MLLTISTTHKPATDLGFLLYKNPANVQSFELSAGIAHVFYSEISEEKCTAALLLDIDPVSLVRGKRDGNSEGSLDQYVNDRPYAATSFISVAIAQVFGSALSGRCGEKPELVTKAIPLEAELPAISSSGGPELLQRLFEPLGYKLEIDTYELDPAFPDWGKSRYCSLKLSAVCTLHDLLSHLYVLIPVLDNDKHYFVGDAEVAKLLRHGEGWLNKHPERSYITNRYLQHKRRLTRLALERLTEGDDLDPDASEERRNREEDVLEEKISLNDCRQGLVLAVLKQMGSKRIIDLGCGEGKLLARLLQEGDFTEIVGMDVSCHVLERASQRLHLERMPEKQKERIRLMQGSLNYKDKRLSGFDAATCIEVIEHLDPPRLSAFERVIFEFAKPSLVILTTPNVEFNAKFEKLPPGKFRHKDHRFEWSREEFQAWASNVAGRNGYAVRFLPVGEEDAQLGAPTQMAVFNR